MSPDKWFDYLDGQLPRAERESVERQLLTDPLLQRELTMAREIHKNIRRDGEAPRIDKADGAISPKGAILGRRVAIAFAGLVLLNVLIGIAVIAKKGPHRERENAGREAEIRRQLAGSLERTAAAAFPVPRLVAHELKMSARPGETNALGDRIVAAASSAGGAATKALPGEKSLTVLAEIPAAHDRDFREALAKMGAVQSADAGGADTATTTNERKTFEIKITESVPLPVP